MSRSALSTFLAISLASWSALAQVDPNDTIPLVSKTYSWPSQIPYQVDPVPDTIRGPQQGYNICNSTTQNQQSECQTSWANSIADFCVWAPPKPNSTIGDTEGYEVAWCSKPGHGTRLIPAGALTGVQVLKTTKYIQWAGFINQVDVDLAPDDYGGELDPHGADLRGNPIGGLMYSTAFSADNTTVEQIIDWNLFIGGGFLCLTICDPKSSESDQSAYCQNIYDRLGCTYNMPNNAQNGTFEVCDSDLKTPVGIYVTNGATMTYSQPFTGTLTPPPYTPVPPKSSNCVTYQSSALYTGLPMVTTTAASTTATGTGAGGAGKASGSGSGTSSASAAGATSAASALGVSSFAGILGTLFAVTFLS